MKKPFILLALATFTIAALVILGQQQTDLDALRGHVDALAAWREANAPALEAGVSAACVPITALSLPVATWITLAAGAPFGFWQGLLIVFFASTLGATLPCLAARYVLRDWIRERLGARAGTVDAKFARDGAFYLFTLRLIPIVPVFVVNFLMGLSPIRGLTVYLVRQASVLAGTAEEQA